MVRNEFGNILKAPSYIKQLRSFDIVLENVTPKDIGSIVLRKTNKSDVLFGIDWIYSFVESLYFYNYRNFFSPMSGLLFNDYCSSTHSFMWILAISTLNFQLFWSYVIDTLSYINVIKLPELSG